MDHKRCSTEQTSPHYFLSNVEVYDKKRTFYKSPMKFVFRLILALILLAVPSAFADQSPPLSTIVLQSRVQEKIDQIISNDFHWSGKIHTIEAQVVENPPALVTSAYFSEHTLVNYLRRASYDRLSSYLRKITIMLYGDSEFTREEFDALTRRVRDQAGFQNIIPVDVSFRPDSRTVFEGLLSRLNLKHGDQVIALVIFVLVLIYLTRTGQHSVSHIKNYGPVQNFMGETYYQKDPPAPLHRREDFDVPSPSRGDPPPPQESHPYIYEDSAPKLLPEPHPKSEVDPKVLGQKLLEKNIYEISFILSQISQPVQLILLSLLSDEKKIELLEYLMNRRPEIFKEITKKISDTFQSDVTKIDPRACKELDLKIKGLHFHEQVGFYELLMTKASPELIEHFLTLANSESNEIIDAMGLDDETLSLLKRSS